MFYSKPIKPEVKVAWISPVDLLISNNFIHKT